MGEAEACVRISSRLTGDNIRNLAEAEHQRFCAQFREAEAVTIFVRKIKD